MTKGKNKRLRFHYGLEFVMSNGDCEIEEVIRKLEAKRNRQEVLERQTMNRLQNGLKADLNTAAGRGIEKELNRRFKRLYVLREKN